MEEIQQEKGRERERLSDCKTMRGKLKIRKIKKQWREIKSKIKNKYRTVCRKTLTGAVHDLDLRISDLKNITISDLLKIINLIFC